MYNNADKIKLQKLLNTIKNKNLSNEFELKQLKNLNWFLQNRFLTIFMNDDFNYEIYCNYGKIEFKNINSVIDFIIQNIPDDFETETSLKYHNLFYKNN